MLRYDAWYEEYGSCAWPALKGWAEMFFRDHMKIRRRLPANWSVEIDGEKYKELWLRHYATCRHYQECVVMSSDYANHMTNIEMPLVWDLYLDRRLLYAHAKLRQLINNSVKHRKQPAGKQAAKTKRTENESTGKRSSGSHLRLQGALR